MRKRKLSQIFTSHEFYMTRDIILHTHEHLSLEQEILHFGISKKLFTPNIIQYIIKELRKVFLERF